MENLMKLLDELQVKSFRITETKNGEAIHQTERNKLKADILDALFHDIQARYEYTYRSEEGILIEIANQSIADALQSEEGSGAITVCLDLKVKNLDCNAENESADYMRKLTEKEEKARAAAEKKAAKIARDKAERKKNKEGE